MISVIADIDKLIMNKRMKKSFFARYNNLKVINGNKIVVAIDRYAILTIQLN